MSHLTICDWLGRTLSLLERLSFKGESWHDAGQRLFLHLYFDAIDNRCTYLIADITLHDGLPRIAYRIALPPDGDDTFCELYRRHCENLRLLQRFAQHAGAELVKIREDSSAWDLGPEVIKKALITQYEVRRQRLGPNHKERSARNRKGETRTSI